MSAENKEIGLAIRRKEREAIQKCCASYKKGKKGSLKFWKYLINLVERSIFKATLTKAYERHLPRDWGADPFVEQYSNIAYNVKINLDINSPVNCSRESTVRSYLISRVYNYCLVNYLWKLQQKEKWRISWDLALKSLKRIPCVDLNKIGFMSSLELNPTINQIYLDELELRGKQHIKIRYSKMYTCSQCGHKKTQMKEIQTRSGDEGGTLFIKCIQCSHAWRQY